MEKIEVKNIEQLLELPLKIPDYQRPYNWSMKSVKDLLNDIYYAYKKYQEDKEYRYRIGTIILYESEDGYYEIVDGQQRITTLLLIKLYSDFSFNNTLTQNRLSDKKSLYNMKQNYEVIENWFKSMNSDYKEKIDSIFKKVLEVLIVKVNDLDESFQLFDSQNTSGKELYPHDLLKAFHLREMSDENESQIKEKVKKWEKHDSKKIAELFATYLYPIKCWIHKENSHIFNSYDIDDYKGITHSIIENNYNYSLIYRRGKYQIGIPFFSGNDFFNMINHYMDMYDELLTLLKENYKNIYYLLNSHFNKNYMTEENIKDDYKDLVNRNSLGMKYACQLFFAALLYYYDRFNCIDEKAIKKIFMWAFMLRVDLEKINLKSINVYALGIEKDISRTTNHIPLFNLISNFTTHRDIYDIDIKIVNNDKNNWDSMYRILSALADGGDLNDK